LLTATEKENVMPKSETQEKLFAAIAAAVTDLEAETANNVMQRARSLERLALAYRYLVGGQQPGSVSVEK
jgi:hypothetical protein